MVKWLKKSSLLLKVILFGIPFINYITEFVLRLCLLLEKPNLKNVLVFILCLVGGGVILGWIDLAWSILFNKFILE